jgi:hypothetical protein
MTLPARREFGDVFENEEGVFGEGTATAGRTSDLNLNPLASDYDLANL